MVIWELPQGHCTLPSSAGPTASTQLGREERNSLRKGFCQRGAESSPAESGGRYGLPRHRTETSPREKDGVKAVELLPPAAAASRWARK